MRHSNTALLAFLLLATLLAGWGTALRAAELDVDARLGFAYDSNLGRAAPAEDRRADTLAQALLSVANRFDLADADSLTLAATLRGDGYFRYAGLNAIDVGVNGVYRHKFGVGLLAPWVSATLSASHYATRDTIRVSDFYSADLVAGKRLSELLSVSAGYIYAWRHALNDLPVVPGISGAVFDLRGQSGFASASYAVSDRWLLEARYDVRRGDVESTSQQGFAIFQASSAIAEDFVLGPNLYAYRLRGTTQTFGTALSYALSDASSLNLTYAFEFTRTAASLNYRTQLVSVTWLHGF
jgi:hypothetical protein